jgi:hypothetical protein
MRRSAEAKMIALACGDDIEEWVYVVRGKDGEMKWVIGTKSTLAHVQFMSFAISKVISESTTLNAQLSAATS